MKNTLLILFLSTILSLVIACNNDHDCPVIPISEPEETVEMVELNIPFLAKFGKQYLFVEGTDSIKIHLSGVNDLRAFGLDCSSTFGTSADVFLSAHTLSYGYNIAFNWPGCDGINEYDITNPNLPMMEINEYKLKMMKMYPLSGNISILPESMDVYEIKLVVLK